MTDDLSSYVRPAVHAPVFHDADGEVIPYGSRWQGSPPEDTYSVDTHPERFAPLHVVADALIAHLQEAYDVEVDEGLETVADLLRPPFHDVVRAVRIRPKDPDCASVTIVFTAYPGIYVHAGLLHDFHYPICGCDACDSEWTAEADGLERDVFAIVTGHYREILEPGRRPWVEYVITSPDGTRSGSSRAQDLPAERLKAAKSALRGRSGSWAPWPRSNRPA